MKRGGAAIGWAVVGERRKDVKYGDMRVGSVSIASRFPENCLRLSAARRKHWSGRALT